MNERVVCGRQRKHWNWGTVEFRQWRKQRAWESEPFAVDASSYGREMAP